MKLKFRKKIQILTCIIILLVLPILHFLIGKYNTYEYEYVIKLFPKTSDRYELFFPLPIDDFLEFNNSENVIRTNIKNNVKILNGNVKLNIIENKEFIALEIIGFGNAEISSSDKVYCLTDSIIISGCQDLSLFTMSKEEGFKYYIENNTETQLRYSFSFDYRNKRIASGLSNYISSSGNLKKGKNFIKNDVPTCIASDGSPFQLYLTIKIFFVITFFYFVILIIKTIKNRNTQH